MFFNAYRSRSKPAGTLPLFHVLKKHNHLRYGDFSQALDLGASTDGSFVQQCLVNWDRGYVTGQAVVGVCCIVRWQGCNSENVSLICDSSWKCTDGLISRTNSRHSSIGKSRL
jgi:hypothetical protein